MPQSVKGIRSPTPRPPYCQAANFEVPGPRSKGCWRRPPVAPKKEVRRATWSWIDAEVGPAARSPRLSRGHIARTRLAPGFGGGFDRSIESIDSVGSIDRNLVPLGWCWPVRIGSLAGRVCLDIILDRLQLSRRRRVRVLPQRPPARQRSQPPAAGHADAAASSSRSRGCAGKNVSNDRRMSVWAASPQSLSVPDLERSSIRVLACHAPTEPCDGVLQHNSILAIIVYSRPPTPPALLTFTFNHQNTYDRPAYVPKGNYKGKAKARSIMGRTRRRRQH